MDYLLRFTKDIYAIVEAQNKAVARNFMKVNYDLNHEDYGIVEADSDDMDFVKNNGGRILVADPESPSPIYKEATGK